jgi:iron complex transport system ATP-binding protein
VVITALKILRNWLNGEDMLDIHSLRVNYGEKRILTDIDLTVKRGEILALIGPNGAGKTTLIRAVSGVIPIQSGEILVDNIELDRLSVRDRARHLAVVPQARQMPPDITVLQTVLLGRTAYLNFLGSAGPHDHALVKKALEQTQSLHLEQRRVGELSGGEQQRVLLARALVQDTPLLLLDEPTTHLDLHHQVNLLNLVRHLVHDMDQGVLMVLHDLNLASMYADRIALMVAGRIQIVGRPVEVITDSILANAYQVPVTVIDHPDQGTPLVFPNGQLFS